MPSWKQLAIIFNEDEDKMEKAFKKWCEEVGYSEEEGNKKLFELPELIAKSLLEVHMEH